MLDEWCAAEGNLRWEVAPWCVMPEHATTSINKEVNPWWGVFSAAVDAAGLQIETEIFPAATDSRFLRNAGVPVRVL